MVVTDRVIKIIKLFQSCLNIHLEFDVIRYVYKMELGGRGIEEDVNLVFIEIKPQRKRKDMNIHRTDNIHTRIKTKDSENIPN